MNRGRRDFEVALEVNLCGWSTIHFRVRIDEGEILALQARELGHAFVDVKTANLEINLSPFPRQIAYGGRSFLRGIVTPAIVCHSFYMLFLFYVS
jgi:hypothetical protein